MPAPFCSETAKVREMPQLMPFIKGKVLDYGCGGDKITPDATGLDGRQLPGVDIVVLDLEDPPEIVSKLVESFDTVYSSHFLEHVKRPYDMVMMWHQFLKPKGHLVLYLPDGRAYDHHGNPEHLWAIDYENFLFWFRRNFCGAGKNYLGGNYPKYFEIVHQGLDVFGPERYSFFIVAQAL